MNLLLTGCFNYSSSQLKELEQLGLKIFFLQNENDPLTLDPRLIDATVCNGLFLHHSIDAFSRLKYIQLTSAGLDRVPLEIIRKRNITLHNARGVYSIPMAEWTLTKVLDIYKQTAFFYHNQSNLVWMKNRDLREINGSTVAIIGAGNVGSEVAQRFKALGASVQGFDINPTDSPSFDIIKSIQSLPENISNFDIIIVTMPLTKSTEGFFDLKLLEKIAPNAIIVNISRGAIFNESDLIHFLTKRNDIVAILDVFCEEPLPKSNELWKLNNVIISPHNSFISNGNSKRMFNVIYNNLQNFLKQ